MAFGDIIRHVKQITSPGQVVKSIRRPTPYYSPRPVRRPGGG